MSIKELFSLTLVAVFSGLILKGCEFFDLRNQAEILQFRLDTTEKKLKRMKNGERDYFLVKKILSRQTDSIDKMEKENDSLLDAAIKYRDNDSIDKAIRFYQGEKQRLDKKRFETARNTEERQKQRMAKLIQISLKREDLKKKQALAQRLGYERDSLVNDCQ